MLLLTTECQEKWSFSRAFIFAFIFFSSQLLLLLLMMMLMWWRGKVRMRSYVRAEGEDEENESNSGGILQ